MPSVRCPSAPAYDAYLRARQDFWRWSKPALDRALAYLQSALDMVGDNALLYIGLGHVHAGYAESTMDEATIRQAEACARKALQLRPGSPEAQTLLASIAMLRGDFKETFRCARQALSSNPNDPDGLFFLGTSAFVLGRMEHTRPAAERLLQIDPLWPQSHLVMLLVGLDEEGPGDGRSSSRPNRPTAWTPTTTWRGTGTRWRSQPAGDSARPRLSSIVGSKKHRGT